MPLRLLAQSDSGSIGSILFWCAVFIVLLVAGVFIVTVIRKRFRDDDGLATPGTGGFSLTELKELYRDGKLTQAEFEKAKYAIIEAVKASAARKEAAAAESKPKDFPTRRPRPPQGGM